MVSDLFSPPFKYTVRSFIFTKKASQKKQKVQIKSTQRQQKENNIETNFLNIMGFRANLLAILRVFGLTGFWKLNAGSTMQSWQSVLQFQRDSK